MDDKETYEKIRKILIHLKNDWTNEPQSTVMPFMIERDLSIKESEATVLLNRMEERGLVENPFVEKDMFRITDYGIVELDTTYDPEYQKKMTEEQRLREKEEKAELKKQEEKEDKRHRDTLKWTKWGVIGAIIVGSIGAITGVTSLIISLNK